jgi:hypothetical protein
MKMRDFLVTEFLGQKRSLSVRGSVGLFAALAHELSRSQEGVAWSRRTGQVPYFRVRLERSPCDCSVDERVVNASELEGS